MRAIWFILKLLLKILMAPVILSLTLFIWICVGIVYVSGLVLGLISMVVALLGVAVLITYSLQNGIKDSLKGYIDNVSCLQAILDGIDQSSINQALANEYASHIAANEQQVEQALEFRARLYESLITGTISKEEYTDYKARYTRIAENAKESIRVLKEKLADVLENRSERNRWISHFTQFSTMETLDRKAVVHMIQSIKVIGKKELEITFTYQDEYQKAIQLIQLAKKTSQRKVG